MDTQALLMQLTDLVTYLANGVLAVFYFAWERGPQIVAIGAAVLVALTFDRLAQAEARFAPQRYAAGAAVQGHNLPRTAQVLTLAALAFWLAATWTFGAPLPLIGAAMWAFGWLLMLLMPQQRWTLLWTMKGYLIFYSVAILGFRLLLWQNQRLSPAQMADIFGGAKSAAQVIAQNTGTLATIGSWLLWVIVPAGYFYLFLQNMIAQPMSLVGPFEAAQDVLAALRTRGNSSGPGAPPEQR